MNFTRTNYDKSDMVLFGGIVFSAIFTLVIWISGFALDRFILEPDQGPAWYYWQLPNPVLINQLILWVLYLAHQLTVWGLIYYGYQQYKTTGKKPTTNLTTYNILIIIANVFFIFLHLIETQLFYDGLAQDVPIWTSQGSVIIMLAVMLILENKRRGYVFGKQVGKPITKEVVEFFRFGHMYIFAWALVYTFWFHPMDNDPQLLTGFFYMFLLFTQLSVAFTKSHLNRKWTALLEGFVAFHAVVVAINNTLSFGSSDMWPMFLSGFLFMVVATYIYGIRLKKRTILTISFVYIIFLIWIYIPVPLGYGRDITYLFRLEALWIPIILYLLGLLFATIIFTIQKVKKGRKIESVS
ncbi:MAG: hypothetical protein JSW11_11775 [Candidatus Heimdallarchaeota archaeon]|nr:MAG: hypothetical protein JSW11_11775 [Candidatus Heimdallarchaeota archaeon]